MHDPQADRVIACSALKRRYRDMLIGDRAGVRLVYLKGNEPLIARRISTRFEHFMPRNLLHRQFEALEEPGPDGILSSSQSGRGRARSSRKSCQR